MSRYIDADKLESELFRDGIAGIFLGYPRRKYTIGEIRGMLKNERIAPTADVVEVRHAYWKETTHITESKRGREIHSKLYNCSYCDAPNGRKKSSYCHWCGAKMDGERSEE